MGCPVGAYAGRCSVLCYLLWIGVEVDVEYDDVGTTYDGI